MTIPPEWIEHRRGDGERLGWMVPAGDLFVAVDLLGRNRSEPVDWLAAEELLDELGIGYLADAYELLVDGEWRRVGVHPRQAGGLGGHDGPTGRARAAVPDAGDAASVFGVKISKRVAWRRYSMSGFTSSRPADR